jgi:hypothetical protein
MRPDAVLTLLRISECNLVCGFHVMKYGQSTWLPRLTTVIATLTLSSNPKLEHHFQCCDASSSRAIGIPELKLHPTARILDSTLHYECWPTSIENDTS